MGARHHLGYRHDLGYRYHPGHRRNEEKSMMSMNFPGFHHVDLNRKDVPSRTRVLGRKAEEEVGSFGQRGRRFRLDYD